MEEAPPEFPKLDSRVEVDVAIVGAGITGLTTAYLLKQAGFRVAVIDQQAPGQGETGHTTAHITYVTDARLHELADRLGRNPAQAFWHSGLHAMREIAGIVGRLNVDCGLRQVPGYLFGPVGYDPDVLEKDAALAAEFGFDVDLLAKDPVFGRPAIRYPNQLIFHPIKYVNALAASIPGQGSHVFTFSKIEKIDPELHELQSELGSIRYEALVLATHVPIQGERGTLSAALFQTKLAAYSTYAIEAELDQIPESLFWDTLDPYHYFRFEILEGQGRVILGGEDHKTGHEEDTEEHYRALTTHLSALFPEARPIRRWSGQVIETPDGLPFIGEVDDNQYLATGFSGNGMTLGTYAGVLIRDLLAGHENPLAELFSVHRKALSGAWDYVRENVDFPMCFLKDRLRPSVSGERPVPGEGALMREDGKTLAVFCNDQGQCCKLSAICPHMGCIVAWNSAERTWDCPCHGSRFTSHGALITGPAESGLTRLDDDKKP